MNEVALGFLALLALIIGATSAFLWMLGGRSQEELKKYPLIGLIKNRIWGRVIAPLWFSLLTILLSVLAGKFLWWYFFGVGSYLACSTLGYGGDNLWIKILRRTIWSLGFSAAALAFCIFSGNPLKWWIYGGQVITGLINALIWGIKNPEPSPIEELFIKFAAVFTVPFLVL